MAENILESYLIRLGATTDTASFTKFHNTLKDAGGFVEGFTSGAVGGFVKLETAIVSTFSAAGVGLISLADKTALADQQFGLMGSRMLMTKNSFRAMQSATDALGVSLNDIVTDMTGELNNEFQDLYQRNLKLGKQLGEGFDSSMVGIRRLRVEFKQFETELEFLSYKVVGELFEKLGFGSGDLLNTLRKFNDWFVDNLPDMADKVTSYLVPAWRDMEMVLKDVVKFGEAAGLTFTNLVAELSGDNSIKSATFDLDNLGKALLHVVNAATQLVSFIGPVADTVSHFMAFNQNEQLRLYNLVHGNLAGAATRSKMADDEWNAMKKSYSSIGSTAAIPGIGPQAEASTVSLSSLVHSVASKYGLDPALLAAVIKQESHGDPSAVSGKGAQGLMQLMPGTAEQYGVTNRFNPVQSVEGGAHYLADLLKQYGNTRSALAAFNEGPGNYSKGLMPSETRSYVDNIMRMYQADQASGGDVIIQSLTINVPSHVTPDRMKDIISDSMTSLLAKRDRNTMAQTAAGPHW